MLKDLLYMIEISLNISFYMIDYFIGKKII